MKTRKYLFLQGVNTPFFATLADALVAAGQRIYRINFTVGDVAFWGLRPSCAFHGSVAQLPAFYEQIFSRESVTDIVLFGDRRPIHLPAIKLAKQQGLRVHVFEEGYFRPQWVTLERDGVNADTLLPRDPAWYQHIASHLPEEKTSETFQASLVTRVFYDELYHLFSFWNLLAFPRYRTHRPMWSALEYIGWTKRFSLMPLYQRRDRVTIRHVLESGQPFFLLPLQLTSDAQIRDHSPFKNMEEVIDLVLASFAAHASARTHLLIKNHPLDTGFVNFHRRVEARAQALGIAERVHYLESGDVEAILPRTAGVVTVNSTVGLSALAAGCPTLTLSNPLYNQPGLTFQGPLDQFWQNAIPPDPTYFTQFRAVLMATTQINGGYYSSEGIRLAVKNSLPVLMAEYSLLETLQAQQ